MLGPEPRGQPMQQVIQSLADGTTSLAAVPAAAPRRGELLIQSRCSLVSAGTERMLVDFGKANWLDKARQQPDKAGFWRPGIGSQFGQRGPTFAVGQNVKDCENPADRLRSAPV